MEANVTKLEREKTVFVEFKSEVDGRTYNGDFTFKRLTIGDIARVGVERARLNNGLAVDETTDRLNEMFAALRFAVVKAPDWWKPEDLFDGRLLVHVHERYMEFASSFRLPVPAPPAAPTPPSAT